jgi:hypothetical protein
MRHHCFLDHLCRLPLLTARRSSTTCFRRRVRPITSSVCCGHPSAGVRPATISQTRRSGNWRSHPRPGAASACCPPPRPLRSGARQLISTTYGHLIKLLLWIGQRRGEIAAFRRSFINVVEKTATLPSSLPKNGHEHVFVLCEEALAYLNALPGSTDPFFPAKHASDERMNGWGKWKIAFDKRCPTAPWCLHNLSLRRTFATTFPADPGDPTPYHHQSGHISAHRRAAPACSSLGCE